ncbi:FAD-binding oxidoreductase [Kaustia mangrovi]|uniref:FAD-binding oxidoreductase n=1 Tax=Kaustia mangrovi TaxID=2593653 RepID=A0A7S8C3P4_9HYPH|nr:FAD-dependent oxidoreductase [Kaustia mangrovi]QPC42786.1 FAD-binding oxidoreductase [Kaustia mangrovi]
MSGRLGTADVIVIGGGLHGCSAALHCARGGLSVAVVEKDTVARHASGVNAGGVRRLGRHMAEIPISVASMALWHRIEELVDDDCGFQPAPQIKVAESEADLAALAEREARLRAAGYTHEELLDRDRLFAFLPALSPHCVGGLASLGDGFAEPYRTTFAFARKARALGVVFHEGTLVEDIVPAGNGFEVKTSRGTLAGARLVNCAGAWSGRFAERLGEPVPLEPMAPMMIVTARVAPFCEAVVGATARPLSFKQMPNGTVVIGGGRLGSSNLATGRTDIDFRELARTARTAAEIFPVMADQRIVRCWAGIEGRMPDDIPVIGPSSTTDGVVHAFGFCGHGFQLGPAVGSIVADLVATGRTDMPIEPFSIRRFATTG